MHNTATCGSAFSSTTELVQKNAFSLIDKDELAPARKKAVRLNARAASSMKNVSYAGMQSLNTEQRSN